MMMMTKQLNQILMPQLGVPSKTHAKHIYTSCTLPAAHSALLTWDTPALLIGAFNLCLKVGTCSEKGHCKQGQVFQETKQCAAV